MRRDDPNNPPQQPEPTTAPVGPYVDPRVAQKPLHPAAAAYQQQLKARMSAEPRGGGPPPPIPRLDQPHQDGMTMADQAAAARRAAEMTAPPVQGTIFTPELAAERIAGAMPMAPQKGITNQDILPERARQDEAFREGHGSMYAVNQPNLAYKYGVIRNGKYVPPQELEQGRPGLKSETVKSLEHVMEFNKQRQAAERGDAAAEKAAEEGLAAGTAKIANPSGEGDAKPVSDEQRSDVEKALRGMDEFDFNTFREIMMKDLVNNEEQRKIVEERLAPLDLSELLMNGRVQQRVPIIPNKYEPSFQSFTGEDELALRRLLMQERDGLKAPDRYLMDKFQLMTLALGIVRINQTVFPGHTNSKGEFDDDLFWQKFTKILKLPFHMLASMGVHYYWFDVRVRKLFVAERLKNG